ncbi:MAG: ABC transporter substrate-binding protein [Dehalococcoidia bacterium]
MPTPLLAAPSPEGPTPAPAAEPRREPQGLFLSGTSAGDAETLNWILAADSASFSYSGQTMDSLATYNTQWQVVLRHLAKPVEVSPDGLVYTITIRDDLQWTGGIKVTAEDYVYTLKNLMFSDWLSYTYKEDWEEMVNGEKVTVRPEVIDDTTFTITRQTVDPEFVDNAIYGLTPYPKHIALKYEGDIKAFTQAEEFNNLGYTGNMGPYIYQEWIRNDKFLVIRNPDFYMGQEDGSPHFEEYEIKIFGTTAARHAAMEAGDITYTGIDPPQVAKFAKMENINMYHNPTSGYTLITYNLRQNGWEGLKDKSVRQALSMSIDKKAVARSVFKGFADPAFSFIPGPSPWFTEEGVPKFGVGPLYDKQRARDMLREAGYGAREVDGRPVVLGPDGEPLKLVLATNSGNKQREDIAFLVRQELGDLGIEVEMKLVPWASLLRQYMNNRVPGSDQEPRFNNGPEAVSEKEWDIMVMGFSTHPIAPSGSSVFYKSDGGINYWGFSNPRVDELFERVKSREALDIEARKKMYAELSRLIAEDQSVDFLVYPQAHPGFQANVDGIEPGMNMGYSYHKWYFLQR